MATPVNQLKKTEMTKMNRLDCDAVDEYKNGNVTLEDLLLVIYSKGWIDGSNDYVEREWYLDDEEK